MHQRAELATLTNLVQEAGLKDALDEMQVHQTMLMPSDDAFEAFFAELRSNATELAQYKDMLQDIILYHVINGTKSTYDFVQGTDLQTESGQTISVRADWSGMPYFRDAAGNVAHLNRTNLLAPPSAFGHIIDRVLFPFRPQTVDEALSFHAELSTFYDALQALNLTQLLNSSNANVTLLAPTNAAMADALAELNATSVWELANSTNTTSEGILWRLVNVHILQGVHSRDDMYRAAGVRYFRTCNTCVSFYVEEDPRTGLMEVFAVGNAQDRHATIVRSDLVAGDHALVHVVDAVLLPTTEWSKYCRYSAGTVHM